MSKARKGIPKPEGFGKALSKRQTGGGDHQSKQVVCLTTGEVFNSYKEAAIKFSVFPTTISRSIKTGKPTKHGFLFGSSIVEKKDK